MLKIAFFEDGIDSEAVVRKGSESKMKIRVATPNRMMIKTFNLFAEFSFLRDIKNAVFKRSNIKFKPKLSNRNSVESRKFDI